VEQLRIGMIGVGGRGGLWHNWHRSDGGRSVVVAGADVSAEQLARFWADNGCDPFTTLHYGELVNRRFNRTKITSAPTGTLGRLAN